MRQRCETEVSDLPYKVVEPIELSRVFKYFLITSSIIIITLPIISIVIIKKDDFRYDSVCVLIGNILLIITYIITLISIGIIAAKNYKLKKNENKSYNFLVPYDSYLLQLRSQRATLIINTILMILGIGEAVFNLTNLADAMLTLINDECLPLKYSILVSSIFENGFKCIYHLSLLVFIMHHHKYENMLKCLIIRIFLYSLSFSCLFQWIFIIFQEIYYESSNKSHDTTDGHNITSSNSTSSLKLQSFIKVKQFLFPLGIEFRISMFIELFPMSLPESKEVLVLFNSQHFL